LIVNRVRYSLLNGIIKYDNKVLTIVAGISIIPNIIYSVLCP